MKYKSKDTDTVDESSFSLLAMVKKLVLCGSVLAVALVNGREQVVPLAQDYSIVWHNDDNERYVEGPGLEVLESGRLIAIVPVVPRKPWNRERRVKESRIHVVASDDDGKSWNELSALPYYSAVPWQHNGNLYIFANKPGTEFRNDDLLLLKSENDGATWSNPVTLFKGHFWNCHTGIVKDDESIYWAVGDLSFGMGNRGPRVVAGNLNRDPMNKDSWRISNAVPFPGVPEAVVHPRFADLESHYLESNVINVKGNLRVLATVKIKSQTTANLCAVFDVNDTGETINLSFTQYSPMPGAQIKFCVVWDELSGLFWATSNQAVDSQGYYNLWADGAEKGNLISAQENYGGNDRRLLMLHYSLDGLNWFTAGCVARAAVLSQSFMYATLAIDGEDIVIISRSSIYAPNQHDADHATFHRVEDFRKLALDLLPEDYN